MSQTKKIVEYPKISKIELNLIYGLFEKILLLKGSIKTPVVSKQLHWYREKF